MTRPRRRPAERACRSCSCTDDRACPGGCYWIDADLCSACGPDLPKKLIATSVARSKR